MPEKQFSTTSWREKLLRASFAPVSSWRNSELNFAADCRKMGQNLRRGAEFWEESEKRLDSPLGAAGEWWGPTPPPPARFGLGWACGEHPEPGAATPTPPYLPTDLEANTTCCTSPNYLQAGASQREREHVIKSVSAAQAYSQQQQQRPSPIFTCDLCVLSLSLASL